MPKDWGLFSVSTDFGDIFSDKGKKHGVLTVKSTSSLFEHLEDFCVDLAYALENQNHYLLESKSFSVAKGLNSAELVFSAKAVSEGKEKDAKIITWIMQDKPRERFLLLTFSVLLQDYEAFKHIYLNAKETFSILG